MKILIQSFGNNKILHIYDQSNHRGFRTQKRDGTNMKNILFTRGAELFINNECVSLPLINCFKYVLFFLNETKTYFEHSQSNSNFWLKMEHHAQSVDDALIGGLSYTLKAGASYVTDHRSVTYFASGGNTFSPAGVRCMKFNIAGDTWMDPSTFRVMLKFSRNYNTGAQGIRLLHWNPAVVFRRARLIAGGVF